MGALLDRFTGNISPAALLTSTFFWTWFDVVPFGAAVFQQLGGKVELLPMTVSLAVSVFVLVACLLLARLRPMVLSPRVFAALSLMFGTGGAACVFAGVLSGSVPVLVVGGILVGAYEAVGIVTSGCIVTCQGTTNALIHIAVALPLNIVPILLIAFLEPAAAVVLACLLPLLSALSFAVYTARSGNAETLASALQNKPRAKQRSVWGLVQGNSVFLAMVLVVTVGFGVVNVHTMTATGQSPFDEYIALAIRAVVSAVVLFGYLRFSWNPRTLFDLVVVVMAVSLVATAVGLAPASQWVYLAAYIGFDLLIWAIIIAVSYSAGVPLIQGVCVVQAVDQLGIFLGTIAALHFASGQMESVAYAALGVAALLLTMGLLMRSRALIDDLDKADFDFAEGPDGDKSADAAAEPTPTPAALAQESLEEVGSRYFLSDRELDILRLLVEGRTVPYIAELLCISGNTVKTHVRHIYTKLDVHDRQELLDVVRAPLE